MSILSGKMKYVSLMLLLSVALNLFLGGYLAARMGFDHKGKKRSHFGPDRSVGRLVEYFPKKERRQFFRTLRDRHDEFKPIMDNLVESRRGVIRSLATDELDEQKLRAAMGEYRLATTDLQRAVHTTLLNMMLGLDEDTRRKILKKAKKAHRHSSGH